MTVKIRLACESDVLQLTTDRSRPEVPGFYEKLGFVSSHYGLKLTFQSLSPQ